jgi:uncharacterized protein
MDDFISNDFVYAVVGATINPDKFGYKVLKKLAGCGLQVAGVNPKYTDIENTVCYPSLESMPQKPDVVVTIVPPEATEQVVEKCSELGIGMIWMQPGSEPFGYAQGKSERNGIQVMAQKCIVVDGLGLHF